MMPPRFGAARAGGAAACFLLVLLVVTVSAARAQDDRWSLEVVGGWGGPVNAVQVDEANQIAYLGAGQRLVILDISTKAEPIELGSINLLSPVLDLRVRGGFAYIATAVRPYRFCVVDVSDPAAPVLVWHSPEPLPEEKGNVPFEVELYGNIAYVGANTSNYSAWDISDPNNVIRLAGVWGTGSFNILSDPRSMHIQGDFAYMAMDGDQFEPLPSLAIYDLSVDPLNPPLVGEVEYGVAGDKPSYIVVDGATAYLAASDSVYSLQIIDVSDPENPDWQGSFDELLIGPARFAVRGGYAYVPSEPFGDMQIIDVRVPTTPVLANAYDPRGGANGVVIVGDTAYFMGTAEGLIFLDLSDPTDPSRMGVYHSPAALRQLAKAGDLLLVSDHWNGFSVLDVSDASRPALIGVYRSSNVPFQSAEYGFHGLAVDGERAYVVSGRSGLEVVDISDPAEPVHMATFGDLFRPQGLALSRTASGDIVAHVQERSALVNVDVGDPAAMTELGSVSFPGSGPVCVVLDETIRLAFCGRRSVFAAVDVKDPSMPSLTYSGDPNPATDVAVEGQLVYVASFSNDPNDPGLSILDVSDPSQTVGRVLDPGFFRAEAVDVQSGRAYAVASHRAGPVSSLPGHFLHVYDVRNPGSPALLSLVRGVGPNTDEYQDVLADEPSVYVVDGRVIGGRFTGLVIFDSRCSPDCDQASGAGVLDIFDFLCFQDAFVAMDSYADCDDNGTFDIFDFLCFQDAFTLGCP